MSSKTIQSVTVQYCPCGHVDVSSDPNHIKKSKERSRNGYIDAIILYSSECPECEEYRRYDALRT